MKLEATWRRDPEGKGGTREALHGNNAYSEGNCYRLSGEWDLLGDVRSDGAGDGIGLERLPVKFLWLAAA